MTTNQYLNETQREAAKLDELELFAAIDRWERSALHYHDRIASGRTDDKAGDRKRRRYCDEMAQVYKAELNRREPFDLLDYLGVTS